MNSILLTNGNLEDRQKYIHNLANSATELIHLFAEKSSLTIKQILDLSTSLSINPRLPRVVWIEEANLLTVPAQNALLKLLEEPPENTSFYLTCNSALALLPTIRSRCQTISLINHQPLTINHLSSLKQVMALSPGDRLALITKRDRSESILWLTQIELAFRDKLHDGNLKPANTLMLVKIARLAQQAHRELSANCSVSLTTQNFLLSLPKTK